MVEIIRAVNHKNRPFVLRDHVTSFVWKWKLYDFPFKKPLVGQNNSDLVFQTPHHFLQMSKFVAGHVTKCDFFKTTNYLFPNRNFALKLQGNCWKDDVVTFSANLIVNIKRLTRYKQKVVLATMLEDKSMPSKMAANTNHTTLLENQIAIKYLP